MSLRVTPDAAVHARLTEATVQPCMWPKRTPEEAQAFWHQEFPLLHQEEDT